MSDTPVFISGALVFMAATPEIPLDGLALVTRSICVPGSHGTVTIREMVLGRVPSQGTATTNLSIKVAYLLVLPLQP